MYFTAGSFSYSFLGSAVKPRSVEKKNTASLPKIVQSFFNKKSRFKTGIMSYLQIQLSQALTFAFCFFGSRSQAAGIVKKKCRKTLEEIPLQDLKES